MEAKELNKIYDGDEAIKCCELEEQLNFFSLHENKADVLYWFPKTNAKSLLITKDYIYDLSYYKKTSSLNNFIKIPTRNILQAFVVNTSFGFTLLLDLILNAEGFVYSWQIGAIDKLVLEQLTSYINCNLHKDICDEKISFYHNGTFSSLDRNSPYLTNGAGRKGAIKKAKVEYDEWFSMSLHDKIQEVKNCGLASKQCDSFKKCPHCSKELNSDFSYCPFCGKALLEQGEEVKSHTVYTAPEEKQTFTPTYKAHTVSPKKQYKANKKAGIVSCPKCGSASITTTNKKISLGKGMAGAAVGALVNPVGTVVGAAVGATHSKKIYNVCMNCGHKWKP